MTHTLYFKVAVWTPAILLPALLMLDAFYFSKPLQGGVEQFFLVYVLGFGLAAYVLFAIFSSHIISKKNESEILRLTWWAPVVFIPFYGAPWILYGVVNLISGRLAGLGMMFFWLAYTPYVLVFGLLASTITVLLFKLIDRFSPFFERN